MRDQKHVPQNRRSFSVIIARSIADGVGSAPDVAIQHLHRGQFRVRTDAIGDAVMIASGL
jgi:hypothetical protein